MGYDQHKDVINCEVEEKILNFRHGCVRSLKGNVYYFIEFENDYLEACAGESYLKRGEYLEYCEKLEVTPIPKYIK